MSDEARFRAIVDHAPDPVTLVSADGTILYVNDDVAQATGYPPGHRLSRNCFDLVHPDDLPSLLPLFARLVEAPRSRIVKEFRIVRPDGSILHTEATATNMLDDPDVGAIVLMYRDVTDRHEANETLRRLHEDLEATLKAIPDLRFEVDPDGRIVAYGAPRFLGLFVPPDVFLGRLVTEVLPPDAAAIVMKALDEALERGWHSGGVYSLPIDGEDRYFQLSIAAKGDPHARDARFIALARDITALKQAEEAVRLTAGQLRRLNLQLKAHSDKLDALVAARTSELATANALLQSVAASRQDYLRAVAHELRTPANTILGVLELALSDLDEKPRDAYRRLLVEPRDRLMTALDAAVRLAAIEHDGGSLATASLDLRHAFQQAFEAERPLLESRGVTLSNEGIWPGFVEADEESLGQCLQTLLRIAARLAAPGSAVVCRPSGDQRQSRLVMDVTGEPLSDELQRTFFDTFSAPRSCSRVESLGLAVPLAALVAQAMGGRLTVGNTTDGVTIELVLKPAAEPVAAAAR